MRVLQIIGGDFVADGRRRDQRVLALSDQRGPPLFARIAETDSYHAPSRGVLVRAHVENRASVSHEIILGIESIDQANYRIVDLRFARIVQIDEVQSRSDVRALRDV